MAEISSHLKEGHKLKMVLSLCTFLLVSLMYIYFLMPSPAGSLYFKKLERLFVE